MSKETNSPRLVLLCGLPYSGKSTVAARLERAMPDAFVMSVDPLVHARAAAKGLTYRDLWPQGFKAAEKEMLARLRTAIAAGRDVIWDQINITRKRRLTVLRRFPGAYWRECVYVLCSSPDEIERRRAERPGQFIPEDVIAGMRADFQRPDMSEGYDAMEVIDTARGSGEKLSGNGTASPDRTGDL